MAENPAPASKKIDVKGGSYTKMLKAMAANFEMKEIGKIKPVDAIIAARSGRVRAATRRKNESVAELEQLAKDAMISLENPAESIGKQQRLTSNEIDGLTRLFNTHKPTQMALSDKFNTLEKTREQIFTRINEIAKQPQKDPKDIEQLTVSVRTYLQEMATLKGKLIEFISLVSDQANNVRQGVLKRPDETPTLRS
jgi:chromosome segregation ATPase